MRKFTILLFLMFALGVSAQSNIHHQLRIAATTTNALLDTFPDTYASEKINIFKKMIFLSAQETVVKLW